MLIGRYHHPIWTKLTSTICVAVGLGVLWIDLPILAMALMLYGAGIGLESIARGTLPLALFGANGYALLMGRLAMPSLLAQAASPFLGALLIEQLGASGLLATLVAVAILNVILVVVLVLVSRPARATATSAA